MKPRNISEKMMYNTVRLVTADGSCGTGSFFCYTFGEKIVTVIVTNKHVVNNNACEAVTFYLHTANDDGEPDGSIEVTYNAEWKFHADKDLCYCYFAPVEDEIKRRHNKNLYYVKNDELIIPTTDALKKLSALESLIMVGYPIGLWDARNNFPIFRRGCTANHPAIDFNTNGIGLVDMACFPGSSGSPIYIFDDGIYNDENGHPCVGTRLFLMGFLFAGPEYSATGDLVVRNIPTKHKIEVDTPIMTNLGYYVKSCELFSFIPQIKSDAKIDL